jgi:CDP-diacylglycerol--glycerol-3-phosphate 3-phosphatidyltransferase
MKKQTLKQIFTIPNILTYLRIIAIPFICYFTVDKSFYMFKSAEFPQGFPFIGFLLVFVAASTDLADGFIARKFNMVSDIGKVVDPVADKLMHVFTILALVIAGHVHYAFILALALREVTQLLLGLLLLKHSKIIPANILGKIASATLSTAVFLTFFHDFFKAKVFYLDWIILGIGVAMAYGAFICYLYYGVRLGANILREEKNAQLSSMNETNEEDTTSGGDDAK